MKQTGLGVLFAVSMLSAVTAFATIYDVGPGQPLATIGAAPWDALMPGDVVRIHYRPAPYYEKWVIGRSGTAQAPIVVQGVLGPNGERPIVSGDGAVTPAPLNFWNEPRGVIKVGGSNTPDSELASYVVIENLDVRSAHESYSFTNDAGGVEPYARNAAAIFVEAASHLTIRNCTITDSGNGLFVAASDGATRDIHIENNWIADNGNDQSIYEHNTYTAAIGIVYDGNRFGPLRAGAGGNNLKDRSAGLVVRYNWIEGGNRQLDLVDAEDSSVIVNDPSYGETFVYGNVLIEPDSSGNRQIVHYGGDSGDESIYRKGILHFFHNTVISTRAGRTSLLRLSTNDESADVRNNVIWTEDDGDQLELLTELGDLTFTQNWVKPGWVDAFGGLGGVIDDFANVEAEEPYFADAANQDFRLQEVSGAFDAAGVLHPDVQPDHALTRQYLEHQRTAARATSGFAAEMGAFEVPEPSATLFALASFASLATLRRRR